MSAVASLLAARMRRFAAAVPVPVFAAVGGGARRRVTALGTDRRLELVSSPRHAALLLVAGEIPGRWAAALARVHDQIPRPRATLLWRTEAPVPAGVAREVGENEDPAAVATAVFRALLAGDRASDDAWLADDPPHPWHGRGEHGQGGEGMMGGVPFGRPMAGTADDLRDGLALDALRMTLGPFFPPFPPGLVLDLTLQGDVVQAAEVAAPPFPQPSAAGPETAGCLTIRELAARLPGLEWGAAVALAARVEPSSLVRPERGGDA